MPNPSPLTLANISNVYRDEYFTQATARRKGFLGALNRFCAKLSPLGNGAIDRFFLPPLFAGCALALIPGLPVAAAGAVMLAVAVASGVSRAVVSRDAKRLMQPDLDSGALAKRYAQDFLMPQQTCLQQQITALTASSLPETGLAAAFEPKAAAAAPGTPAGKAAAPPIPGL